MLALLGAGTALGGFAPAAEAGMAPAGRTLAVRDRWATGNEKLAPPAGGGELIHLCGDRTIGTVAAGTPRPLWLRPHGYEGGATFRPRIAGDLMVCGGLRWIAGIERHSGRAAWHYAARTQTGVPAVGAGLACFGDGHEIVALDLATGAPRWRFAAVPDTLVSYAPVIAGDLVLAGPGDGRLYALEAASGSLRWSVDGREPWQYLRQLYVDGGLLVAGSYKERLLGLRLADGSEAWSFNAGNFINSHHVRDGAAYLWSPTGWLYAIDTATGVVRWRHRTTDYDHSAANWASLMAELTTEGGRLYALDMDSVLHVLDTATGEEIARVQIPGRVRHAVLPLGASGIAFSLADGDLIVTEPV